MRIVVLVLALAAVAFAAKYALDRGAGNSAHTAPRRDLDNVRDKAKDLERKMQKAADDAAKSSDER
jgi:Ni/Co efflux regulator RcnB